MYSKFVAFVISNSYLVENGNNIVAKIANTMLGRNVSLT